MTFSKSLLQFDIYVVSSEIKISFIQWLECLSAKALTFSRIIFSTLAAISMFFGYGIPCEMIVDSSATTGSPWRMALRISVETVKKRLESILSWTCVKQVSNNTLQPWKFLWIKTKTMLLTSVTWPVFDAYGFRNVIF